MLSLLIGMKEWFIEVECLKTALLSTLPLFTKLKLKTKYNKQRKTRKPKYEKKPTNHNKINSRYTR